MAGYEWFRSGKVWPPSLLSTASLSIEVRVERHIGYSPASQIKEALALHCQLHSAFKSNGIACKGLTGEGGIQANSVYGPCNRRIIDGHTDGRAVGRAAR